MDTEAWYKKKLASVKDDFDFKFESFILDITESIREMLKEKGITMTNLAGKLNVTPAAISKLLRGESNFTIKKLMEIAEAIDLKLEINLAPKEEQVERPIEETFHYLSLADVNISKFNFEKTDDVYIPSLESQAERKTMKSGFSFVGSSTLFSTEKITDAA